MDALPSDAADFMRGWSLEATYPTAADVTELRALVPPGARLYLSALANQPHERLVASACSARAAGLEPVPHIAARHYQTRAALVACLDALANNAGVRTALIVGGDRGVASGPFSRAEDVIASGILQRFGVTEIGVGGYPDGHPRIPSSQLEEALQAKLAAAQEAGMRVKIVSQFCFDPLAILSWLRGLRASGITTEVRIGMAGPASVPTLLRYARRCGVSASVRAISGRAGTLSHLLTQPSPARLVSALASASADGSLGCIGPHFFSFGGLIATARWALTAAGPVPESKRTRLEVGVPPMEPQPD